MFPQQPVNCRVPKTKCRASFFFSSHHEGGAVSVAPDLLNPGDARWFRGLRQKNANPDGTEIHTTGGRPPMSGFSLDLKYVDLSFCARPRADSMHPLTHARARPHAHTHTVYLLEIDRKTENQTVSLCVCVCVLSTQVSIVQAM